MQLDRLINIVQDLGLEKELAELKLCKEKLNSPNKDLVIPFVGEYSSGKTSLINALLDNGNLKVDPKPTTETIYEIHFGSQEWYADYIDENDETHVVNDIEELTNINLNDAEKVRLCDTSTKIDPLTIILDTPGLSSPIERHAVALGRIIPTADAIILVSDVQQGFTRSLLDFVNNANTTGKTMFLVFTKCDRRTEAEVESVVSSAVSKLSIPIERIARVSANKGDLKELFDIFEEVQTKKNTIVEEAIGRRVEALAKTVAERIGQLMEAVKSPDELEKEIDRIKSHADQYQRNVNSLIDDCSSIVSQKREETVRSFSSRVRASLDQIITSMGRDCDGTVKASVNQIGQTCFENFKLSVKNDILHNAREKATVMELPVSTLETMDLSEIMMNQFSYNIDLSSEGHKYDKTIGNTLIAALAITAVVATAGAAAGAAGASGAAAAGTGAAAAGTGAAAAGTGAAAAGTGAALAKGAKVAVEVGELTCMAKLSKKAKEASIKINKLKEGAESVAKEYEKIQSNEKTRGKVESLVSFCTDGSVGRPQRMRRIDDYIEDSLIPELKDILQTNGELIVTIIQNLMHQEAESYRNSMTSKLEDLKAKYNADSEKFAQAVEKYKSYRKELTQ